MKHLSLLTLLIPLFFMFIQIKGCVLTNYEYENKYEYAWDLADKSSTIKEKAFYINEFVNNIERNRAEFSDYNAIWLKTNDNNFDKNLQALKTLRQRLVEIQNMDANSFEYQIAIQQITQQEQGEADQMLGVLWGCYFLNNCWYCWDWYAFLVMFFWMILWGISIIFSCSIYNKYY